ncbi:MAG: S-layer homology domain-containing protein [bacterium]|nr:S-layer homology domain-containing protein [bacterium]
MFASLSRFRRQIAVLTALVMMASVLVAVPAVAADPEADYTATFDACEGVGSADFTDVPAGHVNAGDIDCIAYYGITKGTGDGSTYSPLMSVTREHMALFLTRLAERVGIEVASDPSDPGFTDTGDLSEESQTAIAQLYDLGITTGTTTTTYSPSDNVKRDHMALFIQRLMDKMDPIADGPTKYGTLPSDVAKSNDSDRPVKSPFTDLGSSTKDEYDAITRLYELGVASGISATSYSPGSDMTRAAMAEFMAGLLDHSNARPSGLSIQASKTKGFGSINDSVVSVSYRSATFEPMSDMKVDVFHTEDGLNENGTCKDSAESVDGIACEQDENDSATDARGNIFLTGQGANEGETRVYYTWTGKVGDKFDSDTVDSETVTITSSNDASALKLTHGINAQARAGAVYTVDLDVTKSVTLTVQLQDGEGANVTKPNVEITFQVQLYSNDARTALVSDNTYKVKTNDKGVATRTIDAPVDTTGATNDVRYDTITITGAGDTVDADPDTDADQNLQINWLETDPVPTTIVGTVPRGYAVISGSGAGQSARVPVTVTWYDQYGNRHRASGQTVTFNSDTDGVSFPDGPDADSNPDADSGPRSASSGQANYTFRLSGSTVAAGDLAWTATVSDGNDTTTEPAVTPATLPTVRLVSMAGDDIQVVESAVTHFFAKENKLVIANVLYSYDSDDKFIRDGKELTLEKFEMILKPSENRPQVRIALYDDDGSSIFVIANS